MSSAREKLQGLKSNLEEYMKTCTEEDKECALSVLSQIYTIQNTYGDILDDPEIADIIDEEMDRLS